jgi:large subunit ribosomal protein L5e
MPPPLQGALDGGLDIPHNEKRLVGWTKEEGLEAEVLKKYIYGGHVAEYMEEMEEEDPEKYNRCDPARCCAWIKLHLPHFA